MPFAQHTISIGVARLGVCSNVVPADNKTAKLRQKANNSSAANAPFNRRLDTLTKRAVWEHNAGRAPVAKTIRREKCVFVMGGPVLCRLRLLCKRTFRTGSDGFRSLLICLHFGALRRALLTCNNASWLNRRTWRSMSRTESSVRWL